MEPQQHHNRNGNIQPAPEPPKVQKFSYYRSAGNKRVFYVLDVNTVDHDRAHVVFHEWGHLEPKREPLDIWEQAIMQGQLKPFRPDPLQYLFAYNISNNQQL